MSRCIESLQAQSFEDFELLLIDDGSQDHSGNICDDYAQRDNRIRVFHKKNGGVSSARNWGLDKALGEWIYFSDADDVVDANGLKNLISFVSDQTDLVMAGYNVLNADGSLQDSTQLENAVNDISPSQALQEMYSPMRGYYQGYLWSKLFRNSVVRKGHHRFNADIFYNEDRLFVFEYICLSGRIVRYSDIPVYHYYQRDNSAMGKLKIHYDMRFMTDFDAFYLMKKCLLKSHYVNNQLIRLSNKGMFSSYVFNLRMMKSNHIPADELKSRRKILLREIGLINYQYFYLRRILGKVRVCIKRLFFR